MSGAIAERKRPRRRKNRKHPGAFQFVWPFLLLCALTPLAVRAASFLALAGPGALRLLFPFMAIAPAGTPAAFAMWAQFPVYGVLLSCFAYRRRIGAGFLAALLLHCAAAALLLIR